MSGETAGCQAGFRERRKDARADFSAITVGGAAAPPTRSHATVRESPDRFSIASIFTSKVPAVPPEELGCGAAGEASALIRERVTDARERQVARQRKTNVRLTPPEVDEYCKPQRSGTDLLNQAIRRQGLSARGYHRILKVARTIADLAGEEHIVAAHVAEAI